jgi:hypothetical protein
MPMNRRVFLSSLPLLAVSPLALAKVPVPETGCLYFRLEWWSLNAHAEIHGPGSASFDKWTEMERFVATSIQDGWLTRCDTGIVYYCDDNDGYQAIPIALLVEGKLSSYFIDRS